MSIALLANRFDVLWVMSQVGHADSKMTMDVYAQLQQRVQREHGRAFDALVRQARGRLYGGDEASAGRSLGGGLGGELASGAQTLADPVSSGGRLDAGAGPDGASHGVRTGCNQAGF